MAGDYGYGSGTRGSGTARSRRSGRAPGAGGIEEAAKAVDNAAQMLEAATMSPREGRRERVDAARRVYNAAKERFNAIRNEESRRTATASAPSSGTAARPFVNSFGEATSRNITSLAYERAMRRQEREVAKFLGRR